jgi:hypothetical protein
MDYLCTLADTTPTCGWPEHEVLAGNLPYPAVVVDRAWNLVDANASMAVLVGQADPALLALPVNVLRVSPHPAGMAPLIVNLGEWRAHLFGRLRREIALTADPGAGRTVPGAARLSLRPARAARRGPGAGRRGRPAAAAPRRPGGSCRS